MNDELETRHITVNDWEMRESGDGMSFTGYAAVFNSPSLDMGFRESIAPGAFARSLKSRNNVRMLLNHNPEKVLASTRGKTLRLMEDGKGLLAEADLPPTTVGRDLSISMQRGDVDSMSFGFTVPRGGDSWNEDGSQRELREVRLIEVSVVTFPAYPATSASVRMTDMLADRTGEDASLLNQALNALEDGKELTHDQAALLLTVVAKMTPEAIVEPAPEPEPELVAAGPSIDVLRAQLDLAFKAI